MSDILVWGRRGNVSSAMLVGRCGSVPVFRVFRNRIFDTDCDSKAYVLVPLLPSVARKLFFYPSEHSAMQSADEMFKEWLKKANLTVVL